MHPTITIIVGMIIAGTVTFACYMLYYSILGGWLKSNTHFHPNQRLNYMHREFLEQNFDCVFMFTSTPKNQINHCDDMNHVLMLKTLKLVDDKHPIECFARRENKIPGCSIFIKALWMKDLEAWHVTFQESYALGGHYPSHIDNLIWGREASQPIRDPFEPRK